MEKALHPSNSLPVWRLYGNGNVRWKTRNKR